MAIGPPSGAGTDPSVDRLAAVITRPETGETIYSRLLVWTFPMGDTDLIVQFRTPYYVANTYGTAAMIGYVMADWPENAAGQPEQLLQPVRPGDELTIQLLQDDGTTTAAAFPIRGLLPYPGDHLEIDVEVQAGQ